MSCTFSNAVLTYSSSPTYFVFKANWNCVKKMFPPRAKTDDELEIERIEQRLKELRRNQYPSGCTIVVANFNDIVTEYPMEYTPQQIADIRSSFFNDGMMKFVIKSQGVVEIHYIMTERNIISNSDPDFSLLDLSKLNVATNYLKETFGDDVDTTTARIAIGYYQPAWNNCRIPL